MSEETQEVEMRLAEETQEIQEAEEEINFFEAK